MRRRTTNVFAVFGLIGFLLSSSCILCVLQQGQSCIYQCSNCRRAYSLQWKSFDQPPTNLPCEEGCDIGQARRIFPRIEKND